MKKILAFILSILMCVSLATPALALDLGGLLGGGPVMDISKISPAKFISRGGRIPAPLQSLKN